MTDKEINKMIGERIAMYLEERGDTQTDLARYLGVTQTSVSNWIKGVKMPRMDKVNAMCNYFHVPRAALLDENYIRSEGFVPVRHYESVSAGNAHNNVIGYYAELLKLLLPNADDYFMVSVKGESMIPTIADGDTVLVRRQSDVESGEIAVVLIDGEDATIKRVYKSEQGITLVADNPSVYPPKFYSNEEIEKLPVIIQGKAEKRIGDLK